MSGFSNADPHIYFTRPSTNGTTELTRYLTSPTHPKMIYLLNPSYKFDTYKYMERQFTITTNKGIYLFNIDLLKDTSSTIRESIQDNPQHLQYHLNIKDEDNIMQKVEQLYLGEKVIFSSNEFNLLNQISNELNLSCNFNHYTINTEFQINLSHFYSYLKKTIPRTFSIITKNKEYQCNTIGIHSSKIIDELLSKDPTIRQFNYDFDDEFGEFQQICDLFNFKFVQINTDNMYDIKMIAEDLQIEIILNDINEFIEDYDKRVQTIDDQQSIIDSINNLFEILFNIKKITVESAKQKIIESNWISTEENIQELVAFILQAIQTDFILHPYLADLIQLLDKESNEFEQLKILVPFLVKKLMLLFGENKLICSFIFLLQQRGIIKKDEIMNALIKLVPEKSNQSSSNDLKYVNLDPYLIFLPELFEIFNSKLDTILKSFSKELHDFIILYFPNKIEDFKKMRESGEPDDQITKALRNDDIDTFQSIVSKTQLDLTKALVPFNIFEEIVPNGQTNYIDYSAAYGSLRCFKYLLLNHATVTDNSFDLAIFGGNIEIVKIIDQKLTESKVNDNSLNIKHLKFSYDDTSKSKNSPTNKIISTIKKHQNDLFDWILEQKLDNDIQNKIIIKPIILTASKNGDPHVFASIVDKGFDFCCFNLDICTEIIQIAANNGFYNFLKFISIVMSKALDKYQNQIHTIFNSNTSVFFGNLSIFKFCFEKSSSLDLNKAISISIKQENIKIIKYIFVNHLDNLKENNRINFNGFLSDSIKLETSKIFDYLFKQIKKIESNNNIVVSFDKMDILTKACQYNKVENSKKITEYILEKKESDKNESEDDFTLPFFNAALSGSIELCQYFIDKKLFIDFLIISFQYKDLCHINKDILDIIIKQMPPESNEIFKTFYLSEAISTKNKSLIEYILNQNALCNDDVLFDAVKTLDIDIVDMILNKNNKPSFINQVSSVGTALNLAVSLNNIEIVKRLLSIPGIDPSLYNKENNTPLITATINLNLEMINLLLDFYGPNLKSQIWQLDGAVKSLIYRVSSNNSQFLAVLNRFFEIDIIDLNCHDYKYSLLSHACKVNAIDIVKILIKNDKINVNSYSQEKGNTPLIIAIDNKNIEIAKLLIECERTNINLRNYKKKTALLFAIKNNLNEIVDIIINDPRFDPIESRLDYAFYISNIKISKQLATLKFLDVNYKIKNDSIITESSNYIKNISYKSKLDLYTTPLIFAARNNLLDKIELIINHPSFDPNQSLVKDAIFRTCLNDEYQIFNQLIKVIDNDVNITNKYNQSLLQIAVKSGCQHIVRDIINNEKFDYDKSNFLDAFNSIFTYANSSFNIITEMYDYDQAHKKLINFKDKSFKLFSCFKLLDSKDENSYRYINTFLKLGADPNEPDDDGIYPLEYAIDSKSIKMIKALIDSDKIDFSKKINKLVFENKSKQINLKSFKLPNTKISSEKSSYSCSYLHCAAKDNQILSLFLNKKSIDFNITDSNGETPLMIACRERNIASVKLLFTIDELDYKHRNNEGKNAIEICMELFNKKCDNPHETKEQYYECLLQLLTRQTHGLTFGNNLNRDSGAEKAKNTPYLIVNPLLNSNNEKQNEKSTSKFAFNYKKSDKDVSNKFEQQTDEKSLSSRQIGQLSDKKLSLKTNKFGQSNDGKLSLAKCKFGQSADKNFSFLSKKSGQSNDEKPSLTTNKFGQSLENATKFYIRKPDQPDESDISSNSQSRSIRIHTDCSEGIETPVDDEIVSAICDTLNLDGLTNDQAVEITSRLSSISEKRCKENRGTFLSEKSSSPKSKEESKERETTQKTREEIRRGSFKERTIRSPSNFLKEKRRHKFDLDEGFDDEYFYEPSVYQNQMMGQQWSQVMQIGNIRNIQFSMIMQQQEQMMMDIAGRKSKNSSVQHKSKKRKNHK